MELSPLSSARPELAKSHEYEIAEVAILDFDRMLGDVDACVARLHDAAASVGIDSSQLREAQAAVENDGGSFEPLSYIKSQIDADTYGLFSRHFIYAPGPEILYPDAQRFLAMLQHADIPHSIMTFGVSAEWQALKLAASGYPMGCTIMSSADKGAQLRAMSTPDPINGAPKFNMQVVQHGRASYSGSCLTFIDDKAVAFQSMPDNAAYKGFWLQRSDTLLSSQRGEVASNVQVIRSLDELTVDQSGRIIVGDRRQMLPRTPLSYRHADNSNLLAANPFFVQNALYMPVHSSEVPARFNYTSFASVPIREYMLVD